MSDTQHIQVQAMHLKSGYALDLGLVHSTEIALNWLNH
jgi:hypothetical protein